MSLRLLLLIKNVYIKVQILVDSKLNKQVRTITITPFSWNASSTVVECVIYERLNGKKQRQNKAKSTTVNISYVYNLYNILSISRWL